MNYDRQDFIDLQKGLKINRFALDEEAITQPNNFFHVSEGKVIAISRRDQAKHDLEVVTAELDKDVRDQMQSDGEKITEALVKAQVIREKKYQDAYRSYLSSCFSADRWEALQNAYRQRADMLKGLIQLHQSGYYGEITGATERREARARFDDRRRQ